MLVDSRPSFERAGVEIKGLDWWESRGGLREAHRRPGGEMLNGPGNDRIRKSVVLAVFVELTLYT
jgi:hypothetical protein